MVAFPYFKARGREKSVATSYIICYNTQKLMNRELLRVKNISACWLAGATMLGGAGAMITGTEDHPLRHVLPEAVNYFQHSGNMLWGGFLGVAAVTMALSREKKNQVMWSVKKLAGAAALAGVLVGGTANALYETEVGYEYIGQHLLEGGKTQEWADLGWGTGYTALVAAGFAAHLRRDYNARNANMPGPQVYAVGEPPDIPPILSHLPHPGTDK